MPQWQVRRIAYDEGEWHCALSRQRELPDWLDQSVEAHHADLALAILSAFVEAQRISAPSSRTSVPTCAARRKPALRAGLQRQFRVRAANAIPHPVHGSCKTLGATATNLPRELRSTQVLVRFFLRMVILIVFAAFGSIGFGRSLAALLWMSTILSAIVGAMRREPPFDAVLNHWDEMMAYAALCCLVSGFIQSSRFERPTRDPMRLL